MLKTKMGADGAVKIAPPVDGFFDEGEVIEVAQYRWHVGLWRQWERARRGRSTREQPAGSATVFHSAANRFERVARELRSERPEDAATYLYLYGYVVECRLKARVCSEYSVGSLLRAQYEAEKQRGEPLEIMGAQGHNLELLLSLANLKGRMRDPGFQENWNYVLRWTTAWRYALPQEVRSNRDRYARAFEVVADQLAEEV